MGVRTAIVTFRSEPRRRKRNYPQVSGPQPVDVNTQYAPQPVAYTQFSTMGRDAAHALPRQWLYQSLAIPEWSSVAAPFFLPGMHAQPSAQLTVSMPKGLLPLVSVPILNLTLRFRWLVLLQLRLP